MSPEDMEEEKTSHQLKRFWDLESLGIIDIQQNDLTCDQVVRSFEETIKFDHKRYKVRLPWREDRTLTSDNYDMAKRRFLSLKKRFQKDASFYTQYAAIMDEYLQEGIIEVAEETDVKEKHFYLPHHAVIRAGKVSTKVRVVFDGSSHENDAPSLNDCLHAGPNMNTDLMKLLVTFRLNAIAFSADIEKAFLQVELDETDRDAVRFLWTRDINDESANITMRMTRVLFGLSPSPFLLAQTINHHAAKYETSHPETSELLRTKLYVDDLVGGGRDDDEAFRLSSESKKIMSEGGMNLRRWTTNSKVLRNRWKNENIETENMTDSELKSLKVLGLNWNIENDTLRIDVSSLLHFLATKKNTKRCVLSASARIFDPVGFLTPFVIVVKCLFQEIWLRGIEWDAQLPKDLEEKWTDWCLQLPKLHEIAIPRYYFDMAKGKSLDEDNYEVHCFCDSSEKAYGAIVYICYETRDGIVGSQLVASKSRVAPLKKVTLPRLELMAAVVGVRLTRTLVEHFKGLKLKTNYWSDSSITLSWIKGSANRWKPFVANRVREIQDNSDPSNWYHCPGNKNPADILTRGTKLNNLIRNDNWWIGPEFLRQPDPKKSFETTEEIEEIELRRELRPCYQESLQFNVCSEPKTEPLFDISRFSNLRKILRITAWIMRFAKNCQKSKEKTHGTLSVNELENAELYWIKRTQLETFPEEIRQLNLTNSVNQDSSLAMLTPLLDKTGAIRVGGRLQFGNFSYAEKHPYILPPKHHFSTLQVLKNHEDVKHGGLSSTLSRIRDRFWILRGRQVVKTILGKCFICRKLTVKPMNAIMAPLPKERILETHPFQTTGVDFAGPVFVKVRDGSDKAYIVLFTCAVTRCIHLELVSNLNSENFMLSLRRFISRRGLCEEIISDNAKTFKRTNKDLEDIWKMMIAPDVQNMLAQKKIKWKFIAERGPWWGGFWERLIRSIKSSLRKTLGRASLNFEEFETTLIEVEAVLNSRPLTFVHNEANEPIPLMPNHFLIGEKPNLIPSKAYPTPDLTGSEMTRRLKYRQTLLDSFWIRWRKEYLYELRSAHQKPTVKQSSEVKPGDVVLISDDKLPRHTWKMGRVQEIFRGNDGVVRSCTLKEVNGSTIRRPIQRLYPLEVQ